MPIKKVVYEQTNTKEWIAEINEFETPIDSHISILKKRIWQRVFTTKKEAEETAQRELDRIMEVCSAKSGSHRGLGGNRVFA